MTDAALQFTIEPQGPFSLRESALFGFGQRHDETFDGTMRLAFCVDGLRGQVGVAVTQSRSGMVQGTITGHEGEVEPSRVRSQVARVLSLDHDARGYAALTAIDPVLKPLMAAADGLRPPLFYSPYEAALWAILSTRRPRQLAQRARQQLAAAAGARFDVAGHALWSVPLPERILQLGQDAIARATALAPQRARRLLAVAEAALRGELCAERLRHLDPSQARHALRALPGIGEFYADLILIRATGVTDVLPAREPIFLKLLGSLYALTGPATPEQAEALARAWAPWRTWAAVLVRVAGPRTALV